MSITLRPYQAKAVERAVWACQLPDNDLLVLATGAGKSIVIAEIANQLQKDIAIFQPSKEIGFQNIEKLKMFVPVWDIGIFSASMGSKNVRKYTFATIGSVYKRPELFAHFSLFIVDEAHLINMKNLNSMFASFIKQVNQIRKELVPSEPPVKIIGLTATPYRNMTGYHKNERGELFSTTTLKLINRVKPEFWKRILVNVGIGDLVEQGYLCGLRYEHHEFMKHEDMKLNKSGTEFDLDDYAVKLGSRQQQVVDCVLEAQKKYKSVLVFCPSVGAANKYALCVPGSRSVSAKTDTHERDKIITAFKDGTVQTIFNMNVLSIGFDHPALDCIIMLRPTRSLALFMQMLGRGVRIAEGKEHCTVIDFSGNVKQLGEVETVQLRKEQFPEFQSPMWELFSTTENGEERWHNRALYTFKVKQGQKSGHAYRSLYGRR